MDLIARWPSLCDRLDQIKHRIVGLSWCENAISFGSLLIRLGPIMARKFLQHKTRYRIVHLLARHLAAMSLARGKTSAIYYPSRKIYSIELTGQYITARSTSQVGPQERGLRSLPKPPFQRHNSRRNARIPLLFFPLFGSLNRDLTYGIEDYASVLDPDPAVEGYSLPPHKIRANGTGDRTHGWMEA